MISTKQIKFGWKSQALRAISALLLREMATTHGRSFGGYAWAILEPVAGIALLTFVFSLAFHNPPLGDNFAMFYATGILPFTIYVQLYVKLMQSIWFSKPLLQFPTITFADAIISRFVLTMMTQIIVFSVILTGIILWFTPRVALDLTGIALALAMTAVLGCGVGVLNCLLISVFPTWQRVWNILHKPMFIISGIFFILEAVPEPYRSILWFNPLIHIIGTLRKSVYPTYDATYVSLTYVFGFGLTCLMVGLLFLRRWHKDILYK